MLRKKIVKKQRMTSGDKLVDWLFKRLMDTADKRVLSVKCKKLIKGKIEKIGKQYHGNGDLGIVFSNENNRENEIEIEYRISKRAKGRVFMHELGHILYNKSVGRERYIRQFEDYLWPRFCEEQKQKLIEVMCLLRIKSRF